MRETQKDRNSNPTAVILAILYLITVSVIAALAVCEGISRFRIPDFLSIAKDATEEVQDIIPDESTTQVGTELSDIIDAFLKDRGDGVACPWNFLNEFKGLAFGDESTPRDATPRESQIPYHGVLTVRNRPLSANMMGYPDESEIYLSGPMVGVSTISISTSVHLEDYINQQEYLTTKYRLKLLKESGIKSLMYAALLKSPQGVYFGISYSGGNALGGYTVDISYDGDFMSRFLDEMEDM